MRKITLWIDPWNGGLRVGPDFWNSPRDAYESESCPFNRVSREVGDKIAARVGDMVPQSPGEFSHVEVEESDLS